MGFSIGNAQHIGSRQQQQDAFGFSDPANAAFVSHGGFLGIVADGVGGLTHGSEASQSAVRAFIAAYHRKTPHESIQEALSRSLREANAAVLRVASEPSVEGVGTTLAAAVIQDHSLHWVSAGDSRIYLLHDGHLTQVTADHIYARQLDEQAAQGIISRAAAQENSERGSLTSYLGQPELKEVDKNAHAVVLAPDDCVILCSDGFYRALDDAEIVGAFQSDLQQACELLVNQGIAKQRKGQDNITVIALRQSGARTILLGPDHRARQVALASVLLLVALIAIGDRVWQKTHPPSKPSPAQQGSAQQGSAEQGSAQSSAASQGDSVSTKTEAKPQETQPTTQTQPAPPKQEAPPKTAKHSAPPQSKKPKKTNAPGSSTNKRISTGSEQPSVGASPKPSSSSQNTPQGAPTPTSAQESTTEGQTSPATTNSPAAIAQPSPTPSPKPSSPSQNTPEGEPVPASSTQTPATNQPSGNPPGQNPDQNKDKSAPTTPPANP
jgi:serine/threonine protein phosphatase PrpC